jgi:hypothetical protein
MGGWILNRKNRIGCVIALTLSLSLLACTWERGWVYITQPERSALLVSSNTYISASIDAKVKFNVSVFGNTLWVQLRVSNVGNSNLVWSTNQLTIKDKNGKKIPRFDLRAEPDCGTDMDSVVLQPRSNCSVNVYYEADEETFSFDELTLQVGRITQDGKTVVPRIRLEKID